MKIIYKKIMIATIVFLILNVVAVGNVLGKDKIVNNKGINEQTINKFMNSKYILFLKTYIEKNWYKYFNLTDRENLKHEVEIKFVNPIIEEYKPTLWCADWILEYSVLIAEICFLMFGHNFFGALLGLVCAMTIGFFLCGIHAFGISTIAFVIGNALELLLTSSLDWESLVYDLGYIGAIMVVIVIYPLIFMLIACLIPICCFVVWTQAWLELFDYMIEYCNNPLTQPKIIGDMPYNIMHRTSIIESFLFVSILGAISIKVLFFQDSNE